MSSVFNAATTRGFQTRSSDRPPPERFSFTGTGSEYFRIWIVNTLLTVLTLGIYSAWAKVRKLQYIYGSTWVAGSSFEYHGKPVAILKGRMMVIAGLIVYDMSDGVSGGVRFILLMALAAVMPWLLWKTLQFRLFNISYRGIRFGFRGSADQAYLNFLLIPAPGALILFLMYAFGIPDPVSGSRWLLTLLALLGLCLVVPFAHQRIKKFQHEESRFGSTYFSFHAGPEKFYRAYLGGFLAILAGIFVIGLVVAALTVDKHGKLPGSPGSFAVGITAMLASAAVILTCYPLFLTMIQNIIWNNTRLGKHRFASDLKWRRVIFIAVTNAIGIFLTFGLFIPFAQMRTLRYRIESMTLLPRDDLDDFIAATGADVTAAGEGMADLLDVDLSL